jgi:hypothetical protein
LRRFHEKFLKLKVSPLQAEAGPGARLKGPDQGVTSVHEEPGGIGLLAVEALPGHQKEDRRQDKHGPDNDPGGNPGQASFVHSPHLALDTNYPDGYHKWILMIQFFFSDRQFSDCILADYKYYLINSAVYG